MELNTIYNGDCLEVLKTLPNESINCCITSPPYWGLRDYGVEGQLGLEKTPEEYVAKMVEVFREVKRVLIKDGTCWLNLGDSYYNYRPGDGGLNKQTIAKNNQDLPAKTFRRSEKQNGLKEKDLVGIPWRVAFALQTDGWYLRQDIIWHKPNPMPESVTDRCTKSHEYIFLLTKNSKYYFNNEAIKEKSIAVVSNNKNNSSGKYGNINTEAKHRQGMSADRGNNITEIRHNLPNQKLFVDYIRSAIKKDELAKNTGISQSTVDHWYRYDKSGFSFPSIDDWKKVREYVDNWSDEFHLIDVGMCYVEYKSDSIVTNEFRNKRSVWTVTTKPFRAAHFATFPEALIDPMIKAGCPVGGVVLDIFMGAGTTAVVAKKLNRNYFGIELNPEYIKIAEKRIIQTIINEELFSEAI